MEFLFSVQRDIHASLTADIAVFADSREWQGLVLMLPLGILFGFVHALTPGHSKSVLAAYVLGSGLRPYRAMFASFVLSLTHIGSAVFLSVVATSLVTRTLVGAGQAPALELVSRLLLLLAGSWLILRAIWRRPHVHGEGLGLGIMAGLVPCPLTLVVMTYAMARGVPVAGLAFSFAMLIGVGAVLALVAATVGLARGLFIHALERHGMAIDRVSRAIDILAGGSLAILAVLELSH